MERTTNERQAYWCWKFLFCIIGISLCQFIFVKMQKYGMNTYILDKILFCGISVICYYNIDDVLKNVAQNKDKKWILALIILDFWIAFSLAGNFLFLYPLSRPIQLQHIFMYIIISLWIIPILGYLMLKFDFGVYLRRDIELRDENVKIDITFKWVLFIIPLIVSIIYLTAFNPGVLTFDSYEQILMAKGLKQIVDYHPAIITIIFKVILSIKDSPTAIILVQIIIYSIVISKLCFLLNQRGLSEKKTIIFCLMVSLMPNNAVQSITIWKDVWYMIALLASLYFLEKIYLGKNINFFWCICSLVGVCLFRQNGIVAYLLCCIVILYFSRFDKRKIIILAISISAILTIKGPLYNQLNVLKVKTPIYLALLQDVVGVWQMGGELPEDSNQLIDHIEMIPPEYTPYWSNVQYDGTVSVIDFLQIYVKTYLKNPILMTRCILCRVDAGWGIYTGNRGLVGEVMETNYLSVEEQNITLPLTRKNNFLTQDLWQLGEISKMTPFFNVFWRTGFFFNVLLFMIIQLVLRKRYKLILLSAPIIAHIVSLLLSTSWMDYRYYWPIELLTIMLFPFLLLELEESNSDKMPLS